MSSDTKLGPSEQFGSNLRRMSGDISESFLALAHCVDDCDILLCVLECLKALYCLVDGPLMWQIALLSLLRHDLGSQVSYHDENFLYEVDGYTVVAVCTVHFDDPFLAACMALS